jgi:hypothetical protein
MFAGRCRGVCNPFVKRSSEDLVGCDLAGAGLNNPAQMTVRSVAKANETIRRKLLR